MRVPKSSANSYLCKTCCEDCNPCSDGRISFEVRDPDSLSGKCPKVVHIFVMGLCPDEYIEIQREFKDECDPMWAPWLTCGQPTVLSAENPEIMLTVPGKYRTVQSMDDFDGEHVRVQATTISVEFAQLRLQQLQACCCR